MTMRRNIRILLATVVTLVALYPVSGAAATKSCRGPRLVGLTLTAARSAARRAGCQLTLRGAAVGNPAVQTIRWQAQTSRRTRKIIVWLSPLCATPVNLGGPPGEPLHTRGQSELITGLYVVGGPLVQRSAPSCRRLEGTPGAGRVTVADAAGGIVAVRYIAKGHLVAIPLSPGIYTLTGVFTEAAIDGEHATVRESVAISVATTVRQDINLSVP
jgi:hypothetical protein